MRRKNPKTLRGWARKYRRMHARADAFEERLIRARKEIAGLVAQRDRANAELKAERDRVIADNWAQYDRVLDQTTARELELFKASPAYKKYQREREAREELQPFSREHKAKAMLHAGNWRQP